MKIELGTEITGCFGAMLPEEIGEIVTISTYNTSPTEPEVKIKWDDGSNTWIPMKNIRDDYFVPKLPAIGYFAVDWPA